MNGRRRLTVKVHMKLRTDDAATACGAEQAPIPESSEWLEVTAEQCRECWLELRRYEREYDSGILSGWLKSRMGDE